MDTPDFRDIVARALAEDLPDITSEAIFDRDERARAHFLMKAGGVLAGLPAAEEVFRQLDSTSSFRRIATEGDLVRKDDIVAEVEASVLALLSGERTALNLMQRASGIATATRRYVDAVAGTGAKIYDTRKTVPGLRTFDKYAVKTGGGENHRIGLFDMYLIKNNHIDRAGSIEAAIDRARARGGAQVMVEVRDLGELARAAAKDPDFILLDNMSNETMAEAVRMIAGRIPLEASGGITLESIAAVAATGVDRISVGALTHSVTALDISFRIERS